MPYAASKGRRHLLRQPHLLTGFKILLLLLTSGAPRQNRLDLSCLAMRASVSSRTAWRHRSISRTEG